MIIKSDIPNSIYAKILLYTGLRAGEACALLWSSVDLENSVIHITQTVTRKEGGGWENGDTKTRQNRAVYLTPGGVEFFTSLKRTGIYVLTNDKGEQLSPRTFNKRYTAFLNDIGKNNRSPHKCRHTYATHLIKGGAELMAVQSLLGHTSVKMTEIYTHVNEDNEYLKDNVVKLNFG